MSISKRISDAGRFVIALAVVTACLIMAAPQKARAIESSVRDGQKAESKYAKVDQIKVHYRSYGKGEESLVFIHGWACNMDFWDGQVAGFNGKKRLILIDLPGHGQSDKPEIPYTMDLFARAIDAVMTDAGVKRAVLVGHSMGTPVIRQFYRKYPEKTLALVIVDGALRPFGKKEDMEQFTAPLRGSNYKEAATQFIDGMLGEQTSANLREKIKSSMLSTPQHVAVSAFDGMFDESIWKEDKINVPVLAVLAKSPFWPPDTEQYYRSIAPKIDFQMWEGVSHFLMMEKPVEFNGALEKFLAANGLLKK